MSKIRLIHIILAGCTVMGATSCGSGANANAHRGREPATPGATADAASSRDGTLPGAAHLPLVLVADVALPGGATRFDYQDIDTALGHLVVTHMNDGSVLILDLKDGSVLKELTGIPVARGVVVAEDVGLVFVTSSPSTLVLIDSKSMSEKSRVGTGNGPDGVGWDPIDKVVGVSDQGDGALSLIPNSGSGPRRQVKLGTETGNVIFDQGRGWFWITVVSATPPDQLVAVDPVAASIKATVGLPGCNGAHGLRLHPDGKSAFVACELSSVLARVDLAGAQVVGTAKTGAIPDVMNVDPGLGWLYMAAEDGDLTVFDIGKPGVALIGHDQLGSNSHSVAVDPATHRVFFPLMAGPNGTPVLRIMRPTGT
jgi:DNA-binding beta-propeller fold protein YncE